jgi:magnesium transporter
MALFTKHYHPPGTTPGSLQAHPKRVERPCRFRLVRYDKGTFHVEEHDDFSAIEGSRATDGGLAWLHVQGHPSSEQLTTIGAHYRLHALALEDVHNTGQRPKVEEYDGQAFVVLALPNFDDGEVSVHQVSFFLATDYVLSFCDGSYDPFGPVLKRMQQNIGKLRNRGSDYLLYALLDSVIDQGFPVLEAFGTELENLEEKIVGRPGRETLVRLHAVKRELILLRRMLWPQREVLNVLMDQESGLLHDETQIYLRDCYDHTIQIMELLETYRDMSVSLVDIYLSSVSNRLNEIMRVLTMIATIFIPLTFIVGVYGMNFGCNVKSPWAMPELQWYYGYPLVWLIMIGIAVGMLMFFRRRHWL